MVATRVRSQRRATASRLELRRERLAMLNGPAGAAGDMQLAPPPPAGVQLLLDVADRPAVGLDLHPVLAAQARAEQASARRSGSRARSCGAPAACSRSGADRLRPANSRLIQRRGRSRTCCARPAARQLVPSPSGAMPRFSCRAGRFTPFLARSSAITWSMRLAGGLPALGVGPGQQRAVGEVPGVAVAGVDQALQVQARPASAACDFQGSSGFSTSPSTSSSPAG